MIDSAGDRDDGKGGETMNGREMEIGDIECGVFGEENSIRTDDHGRN